MDKRFRINIIHEFTSHAFQFSKKNKKEKKNDVRIHSPYQATITPIIDHYCNTTTHWKQCTRSTLCAKNIRVSGNRVNKKPAASTYFVCLFF